MSPTTDPLQYRSQVAGITAAGVAIAGIIISLIRRRARRTVQTASGQSVSQAGRDIRTLVQGENVHVAIANEGQRQDAISTERQRRAVCWRDCTRNTYSAMII
jgi:hypothetical protein